MISMDKLIRIINPMHDYFKQKSPVLLIFKVTTIHLCFNDLFINQFCRAG